MLTIFGKKKKEDQTPAESLSASETEAPQPMSTPSQSPSYTPMAGTQNPVEDQPQYRPVARAAPPQQAFRLSPTAPLPAEETSLTRLLQSLLQDIPLPPGVYLGFASASQTTPDYVPVRSTPPSRPMVIGPGKSRGKNLLNSLLLLQLVSRQNRPRLSLRPERFRFLLRPSRRNEISLLRRRLRSLPR